VKEIERQTRETTNDLTMSLLMMIVALYTTKKASKEGVGTKDGGLGEATLHDLTADGSNNVGKAGINPIINTY
jgi:hypothetical protein